MSQSEKAVYYKALKDQGVQFDKHYREYSTADLKASYDKLVEAGVAPPLAPLEPPTPPPRSEPTQQLAPGIRIPVRPRDPNEMAGQRLNTKSYDEPLRQDPETGFIWYQEEVLKPGYPKPRGRRVIDYVETGTEVQTVKTGEANEAVESFEIAGRGAGRPAQVKITLPSYQVGIYKDPRFPFKIHTYNGKRAFDREDIDSYFGGADLVPDTVKRTYVENSLCYDMRSVITTIEAEARHLALTGRLPQ